MCVGFITSSKLEISVATGVHDHWQCSGKRRDECISIALRSMLSAIEDYKSRIFPLDICKEFRLTNFEFSSYQAELERASEAFTSRCHKYLEYRSEYLEMHKIFVLRQEVHAIENALSNCQLSLYSDFSQRMKVLRELNYIDNDSFGITLKGRVACEINTSDELLVTEIIFSHLLEPLNPPECVATLSALVCQEKSMNVSTLTRYIIMT